MPGPQLGEPAERKPSSAARRHARRLMGVASDELTRVAIQAGVGGALVGLAYVINHWR
ncbi:hypothetical protein ABZ921_31805 [Streptomyces atriruber]|uniref:Uncharacterized protein n=1 Tax=Streptomyces atriruber TaxID=545121 RepID=A0ABV3BXD5_9ACTN